MGYSDMMALHPNAPFKGSIAVTPNDSTDIVESRGIIVDSAGAVKMTFADDSIDTITLAANVAYPYRVKRVWSTSTTATGIHAQY